MDIKSHSLQSWEMTHYCRPASHKDQILSPPLGLDNRGGNRGSAARGVIFQLKGLEFDPQRIHE